LSGTEPSRLGRIKAGLKHAFAVKGPHGPLDAADRELLDRVARAIHRRGMAQPAILFLGSVGPLNYIGSQAMVFLRPFLTLLFSEKEYGRFTEIMERREGPGALVDAIEAVGVAPAAEATGEA